MEVEDLLKPRYKVIAPYPGMKGEGLEVGQIITCRKYDNDFSEKLWCEMNDKYPHLFRKLKWFQDRELRELPKYLKNKRGNVFKVDKYSFSSVRLYACWNENGKLVAKPLIKLQPATESEYLSQIPTEQTGR